MKWFLPAATALTLLVHVPPFLRTGLNLDANLFDLFVRDAARGKLLYRDMVENKPPGMFAATAAVRCALGPSPEALRAADLAVVLASLGLLARWVVPGARAFAFLLLVLAYFSVTEWQHTQADTWSLLPILGAMRLRARPPGRGAGLVEGFLWGLGVWLKPHVLVAAAAVWLAHAAWANGRGRRAAALDLAAVLLGGLLAGGTGVGLMLAAGMWGPFVDHELTYAPEYLAANFCGPYPAGLLRLNILVRNAPFDLPYGLLTLLSPVLLGRAVREDADPRRVLLLGLLAGWAFQAWVLQHIFDYAHTAGVFVGVALAADYIGRVAADGPRGLYRCAALTLAGYGAADQTVTRAANWPRAWAGPSAALRDDLAKFPQFGWVGLDGVAEFLRREGVRGGELVAVNEAAFPLYKLLDVGPPGRFYLLQNNLLGFRSRRAEILADVCANPIRYAVVDIKTLRAEYPLKHTAESPLPADWGGPHAWAGRVRLRAGRYIVVAVTAGELPQFLADVSDYGPGG